MICISKKNPVQDQGGSGSGWDESLQVPLVPLLPQNWQAAADPEPSLAMNMKHTNNHRKAKPRPVDFFGVADDYEAAFLGSLGFSTRCIMKHTKLRPGQITYRLKKAEIRRIDYRDGTSDTAKSVLRNLRDAIEKDLNSYLKGMFLDE